MLSNVLLIRVSYQGLAKHTHTYTLVCLHIHIGVCVLAVFTFCVRRSRAKRVHPHLRCTLYFPVTLVRWPEFELYLEVCHVHSQYMYLLVEVITE